MPGESRETIRHKGDGDPLSVTRLELLRKGARVLHEAVAGHQTLSAPPWTTLASVHAALAALVSGDIPEPVRGHRLLAEELITACERLRSGQAPAVHATAGAMARGIDQLADGATVEGSGACAGILPALEVIEDLRTLRGGASIVDSPCFKLPNFAGLEVSRARADAAVVTPERLAQLRAHYQRALLEWVRDYANPSALGKAQQVLEHLATHGLPVSVRPAWHCVCAWLEGVSLQRASPTPQIRRLLGAIANAIHQSGSPPAAHGQVPGPLLRQVLFRLTCDDQQGAGRTEALRASVDLKAVFVPTPMHDAGPEVHDAFESVAAEMDDIAAGGTPRQGIDSRVMRCLDVLALQGRYGERAALTRQLPVSSIVTVNDGGRDSDSRQTQVVDWSWVALSLRALPSGARPEGADVLVQGERRPQPPAGAVEQMVPELAGETGSNPDQRPRSAEGPLAEVEPENAGGTLRKLDAGLVDLQTERSSANAAGAKTEDSLQAYVRGPFSDRELVERLRRIAREIDGSRHEADQQMSVIRDDALTFDRVLRGLQHELRRLRSRVGASADEAVGQIAQQQPAILPSELITPLERLTQVASELGRIKHSLEQARGRVGERLRNQAIATGALHAAMGPGRHTTLGSVWDDVVPVLRAAAKARGLEVVFTLTGAAISLPAPGTERFSQALSTTFVSLFETLCRLELPAHFGSLVVDVSAQVAGPRLDIAVGLRGEAFARLAQITANRLVSLLSPSQALDYSLRVGSEGFSLSIGFASKVMKLMPFRYELVHSFAVPTSHVLGVLRSSEVESKLVDDMYVDGGRRLPVVCLASGVETGLSPRRFVSDSRCQRQFLHLKCAAGAYLLAVDAVEEPLAANVEPLPNLLIRNNFCLGAAVVGDDTVIPVLRVSALGSYGYDATL